MNTINEYCPHCEMEVELQQQGDEMAGKCPNCGNTLLFCSLCDCDKVKCSECPHKQS